MSNKKGAGPKRPAKTNPVVASTVVPIEVQPPVEPAAETLEQPDAEKSTLSPAQELVEKYRAAYPDNKVFYVTSDLQLFLSGDYNMALLHQKTIGGELETVKI